MPVTANQLQQEHVCQQAFPSAALAGTFRQNAPGLIDKTALQASRHATNLRQTSAPMQKWMSAAAASPCSLPAAPIMSPMGASPCFPSDPAGMPYMHAQSMLAKHQAVG